MFPFHYITRGPVHQILEGGIYTDECAEDEPLEEQEGKSIEEWYEQKDNVIYRHYRYVDIEAPDDYEEGTEI